MWSDISTQKLWKAKIFVGTQGHTHIFGMSAVLKLTVVHLFICTFCRFLAALSIKEKKPLWEHDWSKMIRNRNRFNNQVNKQINAVDHSQHCTDTHMMVCVTLIPVLRFLKYLNVIAWLRNSLPIKKPSSLQQPCCKNWQWLSKENNYH